MKHKSKLKQKSKETSELPESSNGDLSLVLIELCESYLNGCDLLNIGTSNYSQEFQKRGFIIHMLNPICALRKAYLFSSQINFFDLILAINILHKIENLPQLVIEMHRLLKSGGAFVFTYEKCLNNYDVNSNSFFHMKVSNGTSVYSYNDGFLQHLLTQNGFFIQHEHEYYIKLEERIESVLIVAEKK